MSSPSNNNVSYSSSSPSSSSSSEMNTGSESHPAADQFGIKHDDAFERTIDERLVISFNLFQDKYQQLKTLAYDLTTIHRTLTDEHAAMAVEFQTSYEMIERLVKEKRHLKQAIASFNNQQRAPEQKLEQAVAVLVSDEEDDRIIRMINNGTDSFMHKMMMKSIETSSQLPHSP